MKPLTTLLCISICLASAALSFAVEATSKPDILMIMPDQWRGDCLSSLDHPAVRTPEIDKLAEQGVLFRRAYSTVTSCIPARYALLTGLYPQTSGVVGYKGKRFSTPPFPELLAKAGYDTILVGRDMHQIPENKSCGFTREILGSTFKPGDYDVFLKRHAPESGGIRKLVKDQGLDNNHWPANPWPLENRLHPTEWIVAQSRKVVEETDIKKPLFLTTSFYAPHPPLFPPRKIFEQYLEGKLPPIARGDWVDWESLSTEGDRQGHRVLLEGNTLRRAQAGYYGLMEYIDAQIADLIEEFVARSERAGRPWVIVFTTDHGEMMGDHGYFRKCEPYEGSANIPFIICASPELGFKAGLRINQPVCLEDIMPTLLALAGTHSPAHVDGVNLVPTMRGEKQKIRDCLHFEHSPIYSLDQGYQALTDGRYKYIWRPASGTEQLFDLQEDPQELHDLSQAEASQKLLKAWRARMVERLKDRPEGFSKNGQLVPGCKYLPNNKGTLKVGP